MKRFFLFGMVVILSSCATYTSKIQKAKSDLRYGDKKIAVEEFKKLLEDHQSNKDELLYLLEYATALQANSQFKESTEYFAKADRLVDLNDYHSVSSVIGATLGGEESIQYKGESYEKFMLPTLNALNYLQLNQLDEALVEARKINDRLNQMKMEGREPYELSPFALYLTGLLWESQRKYDDAFIDYEKSYKLDPWNHYLKKDLLRLAQKARRFDDLDRYKKDFSFSADEVKEILSHPQKSEGEIIVIYLQGFGPEKRPSRNSYRLPELDPVLNETKQVRVTVRNSLTEEDKNKMTTPYLFQDTTKNVYDINQVAQTTLAKDYNALIARRVGSYAAKAVVASQVHRENKLVGDLLWIGMNLADRADLRHWSTLPSSIQIFRQYLVSGSYQIQLEGLNAQDFPTDEKTTFESIQVKPGQKIFLIWRSFK